MHSSCENKANLSAKHQIKSTRNRENHFGGFRRNSTKAPWLLCFLIQLRKKTYGWNQYSVLYAPFAYQNLNLECATAPTEAIHERRCRLNWSCAVPKEASALVAEAIMLSKTHRQLCLHSYRICWRILARDTQALATKIHFFRKRVKPVERLTKKLLNNIGN